MILISHRGNINGRRINMENNPEYINLALDNGYNVEIDVWFIDGEFILGHDNPLHKVNSNYLKNDKLWCHAKNIDALYEMIRIGSIRCFWHQEDSVTLTSDNYIWTYPGESLTQNSICVLPELYTYKKIECAGVCSDYINRYRYDNI